MNNTKNYLIVGGDIRLQHLGLSISNKDNVYIIGHPKSDNGMSYIDNLNLIPQNISIDFIILPVVCSRDEVTIDSPLSTNEINLLDIIPLISVNTIILAGNPSKYVKNMFKEKGIEIIDYFKDEVVTIKNAVATAEGALEIILRETPKTIFEQNCLVTGYGRISKIIAKYLLALNANVEICARSKEQIIWSKIDGIHGYPLKDVSLKINKYDIIINTIPHLIFDTSLLENMKKSVFILDLASPPGGVNLEQSKILKLNVNWALSLPSKTAPLSAAEYIYENIQNIINERV